MYDNVNTTLAYVVYVQYIAFIDSSKIQTMHQSRNDTLSNLLVNAYRKWRNFDVIAKRMASRLRLQSTGRRK